MAKRRLPPLKFLRECFEYDPVEGVVRWRRRPERHFALRRCGLTWNTRYAGTVGVVDKNGYHVFRLDFEGRTYRLGAHTIAFALTNNTTRFSEVDHRNVTTLDNREGNLRAATRAQNNANRRGWSKSGMPKGVTRKASGRYMANCCVGGRTTHLGTFDTAQEAHAAYCSFAAPIHGEFFNPGPAFKALVADWYEPLDVSYPP